MCAILLSMTRPPLLALLLFMAMSARGAVTPSKAELLAGLDRAFVVAAETPPEGRRELAYSLSTRTGDRRTQIHSSLVKIALRPSGNGWYDLVVVMGRQPAGVTWEKGDAAAHRAAALEFLEGVYRTRAGANDDEARQWQRGLAEILFTTGRFDEALRLEREIALYEPSAYHVILLAMMEKVAGNDEPFAKIKADCPQPAWENEGKGAAYCTTVINSVARSILASLAPEQVPPAVHEMLTGAVTWEERMHGFEIIRGGHAKGVRAEIEAIIVSPDAPEWAKADAIMMLARLADLSEESGRIVGLLDCWLALHGVSFPSATTELWQQLAAMPFDPSLRPKEPNHTACYFHHDPSDTSVSTECVLYSLTRKVSAAFNAKDVGSMRAGLEAMAFVVVKTGQGQRTLSGFLGLVGTPAERERSMQYQATMTIPPLLDDETAAAVRKQKSAPLSPWEPVARKEATPCSALPQK